MLKRRILVVDDLPDVRETLAGLLADEGYSVRTASSQQEALDLLAGERFHVALLDVRLYEPDVENREGLGLLHEIKNCYPTTVTIILTGHGDLEMAQEALQPDHTGHAPAYKFLIKTPETYEQLPEIVQEVFTTRIKINLALEIENQDEFIPQLCAQMRFRNAAAPPPEQLAEEAEEIVRKLFLRCIRVEPKLILNGYSGVGICRFTPLYPNGLGQTVIAKIGDATMIESEVDNYRQHVQGMMGGNRVPNVLEAVRTHSLAGVLYSFAGLGASQDFPAFYEQSKLPQIQKTLRNLFQKTCFPSRFKSGQIHTLDLCQTYTQILHLQPDKLYSCLDKTMGKRHPFRKDADGRRIWLGDEVRLINPVQFVLSTDLTADSFTCVIHGDLHGYNVIVDQFGEAWLIDFANTGEGPLIQDYVSFETYLRVSMIKCQDWRVLYEWDQALFGATDLCVAPLPEVLSYYPEIVKAHHAILTVRELACSAAPSNTQRTYLIGLLFMALKLMTIMNLSRHQRDHALMSAALIAQRVQQIDSSAFPY